MSEERIYEYIQGKVDAAFLKTLMDEKQVSGITTREVAETFAMARPNASALLNQMVKKGLLAKVESRPVFFLPVDALREHGGITDVPPLFTPESFLQALCPAEQEALDAADDPFDILIGSRYSLFNQVEQAKAAIMYPPMGLHTLIIGESGTGKTLFARTMHEFGLTALKKSRSEYSYVEFNCSDYYHNPQLLMSHLFGHVKGAFTGAGEETKGIVEKADGGILFLDEIHRLPPEGQELLFYLMDKGKYRKLGESANMREAQVLIIAATTEEPSAVLLKTFMRRIPLTISLPSFRDKPIEEKIKLIENIFKRESTATRRDLIIAADVVKALACHDFPGNIGQLNSEIKVLCARTFLNNTESRRDLRIDLEHLSEAIRTSYLKELHTDRAFPGRYNSDIMVTPSSNVEYLHSGLFNETSYHSLLTNIDDFIARGLSQEEINEALAGQIHEYYSNVLEKFYDNKINKEEIYKVVEKEVVDFTVDVMQDVFLDLDIEISQRSILVMAFHIKYLLERVKSSKTISRQEISQIEREYGREMEAAQDIVQRIHEHFGATIPKNEKYFIAILLANMNASVHSDRPALFVIAHGPSTASSIAGVCNQLMDCDIVRAIDAPLEQSVQETYKNVRHQLVRLDPAKGAILMVDMGSLTNFGDRLTRETGIPTRTLANVSTLMALEVTRIVLGKEDDLDVICRTWQNASQAMAPGEAAPETRSHAIITVCASGVGTSEAFKSLLEEELEKAGMNDIAVLALNFNDVKDDSPRYRAIREKHNVLACVGNIHYETDIPFVHVSKLISQRDKEGFLKYIGGMISVTPRETAPVSLADRCRAFLEKNVTYINPVPAVDSSMRYLEAMDIPKVRESEDLQVSLILHLCFMLERNICNKKIVYDGEEVYIAENRELYDVLRGGMSILEESFDLAINDAEICYIIQTINKS